jgi:hypothetical protein
MPVFGDLRTMSLCDLLQWASVNRKTGVLELERNKLRRQIEFRNGSIGACASDDPPSLLGQFLLARGKIDHTQLREALARQQETRKNLGMILHDMGCLSKKDLARLVKAKAEETIQGLFDWDDAIFRFHEGATLEPNQIEVSLSVDDILLKGIQHHDELQKIRAVFRSSGIVLARTDRPAPQSLLERTMARRIFESVDGKRSIAEILLHAHASEFLVIKLLHTLHRNGLIEIREERPPADGAATLLDPPTTPSVTAGETWEAFRLSRSADHDIPADSAESLVAEEQAVHPATGSNGDLDNEIDVANRLISRNEYEAALELLNASYRAHPNDDRLRQLIARTESSYVDAVQHLELSYERIPVPIPAPGDGVEGLGPQECYLLSLMDGKSDIRSILWVAPLREVDVLRSCRILLQRGVIELKAAAVEEA